MTTTQTLIAVLGTIVVALVAGACSIAVAMVARRSSKDANAIAFANTLNTRLTAVETDLKNTKTELQDTKDAHDGTRRELTAAQRIIGLLSDFVNRYVAWGRAGRQGEQPWPSEEIHAYLDQDAWQVPSP